MRFLFLITPIIHSMNEFIIIIALILFNGLLSMSEIALISARKCNLSNDMKRGNRSAATALKLANEPDKFLSTIQIGIAAVGILTGIYSGDVLATDFSVLLVKWGVPVGYSHTVAQIIIVVFVTYLTLIFGELVPKKIGMTIAEKIAKIVARPMHFLAVISSPFVWILTQSTTLIFNLLRIEANGNRVTEEEIKSMVQEGIKGGEVQEVEQGIVERVFLLGDLKINSLMTHRNDIVWLDVKMSNSQIQEILEQHLFEIYPVADRSLDSVRGIVSLKDLVLKFGKPDFNITQVVRPASYFHENMSVYKALEKMKELCISEALVCDEFGSCKGIITLKDILEGLVGSFNNNYQEPDIIKRQDNEGWLVDGQCPFYDFLSYFERECLYSNNSYHTLSGLVLEQLEHIPTSGEYTEWNGFIFEVIDMDGVRIDKILVTTNKKFANHLIQ